MSFLNKKNPIQAQLDPMLAKYLQGVTGSNTARMGAQYADLGLDTSNEAMGMSPQEATDLNWLNTAGNLTATELQNQGTQTQLAANNLTLSQLQQSAQNAATSGTLGGLLG